MRRRRMWVAVTAVAAILLAACPPPEEAPPPEPEPPAVKEPPAKARDLEPTDRPQPVSNARGLATIDIDPNCGIKDYSRLTFAERQAPQVWRITSRCQKGVEVELRGFQLLEAYPEGEAQSSAPSVVDAIARAGREDAEGEPVPVDRLFERERLGVEMPALDGRKTVTRVLVVRVLGDAVQGLYRYMIALDGVDQETRSPYADIREPR